MNRRKALLILVTGFIICLAMAVSAANPPLPKAGLPFLITTAGQTPDSEMVRILSDRAGLKGQYKYEPLAEPADLAGCKTILLAIGGSGKGLGAAGIDIADEEARVDRILAAAKKANIRVIGMHIGGEARRGANSVRFVPYAGKCSFLIIKADGNADGYFTKISRDKKIPMYTITQTIELAEVLKNLFGVK